MAAEHFTIIHTYIHTYNFICFSRLQKKAAYADVDLLKTYLKYLQHLIGLILQITLKYLYHANLTHLRIMGNCTGCHLFSFGGSICGLQLSYI